MICYLKQKSSWMKCKKNKQKKNNLEPDLRLRTLRVSMSIKHKNCSVIILLSTEPFNFTYIKTFLLSLSYFLVLISDLKSAQVRNKQHYF